MLHAYRVNHCRRDLQYAEDITAYLVRMIFTVIRIAVHEHIDD